MASSADMRQVRRQPVANVNCCSYAMLGEPLASSNARRRHILRRAYCCENSSRNTRSELLILREQHSRRRHTQASRHHHDISWPGLIPAQKPAALSCSQYGNINDQAFRVACDIPAHDGQMKVRGFRLQASIDPIDDRHLQRWREEQGNQSKARPGSHRREVAKIHRERTPPEVVWTQRTQPEMDILHLRITGSDEKLVATCVENGCVVPYSHQHIGRL